MRRFLAPLAAVLLLASCDHLPSSDFLDQIQQATVRKCSFLPTIKVLMALINAHPSWTNAAEIAERICSAVATAPPGARGVTTIESVRIDGLVVTPK